MFKRLLVLTLCLTLAAAAPAAEITMQSIDTDLVPMIERFEKLHPGDKIHFRQVSYQSILESLPVQLASGQGPDISLVADWGGLAKYALDMRPYVDGAYFDREFPWLLPMLRPPNGNPQGIYGVTSSVTLTAAFVNLTLFRQAGVAVPGPGATWDDWAAATRKVAKATRLYMAMEMDRSAHRFAALALAYGAKLVGPDGRFVADEGLKAAIRQFAQWHRDGTMPMDLWGAVGGATHRDNFNDFINGKVPFYYGGSWTLRKLNKEVGDEFEWAVVPAPCGPHSCELIPGGGAMEGFTTTREPRLTAQFLAFLVSEGNMRETLSKHVDVPAGTSLIRTGVEYVGVSGQMKGAMRELTSQVPRITPAALAFQSWRFQRAAMNAMTTRISQVLNGELTVDRAVAFMQKDVDLAIGAAQR